MLRWAPSCPNLPSTVIPRSSCRPPSPPAITRTCTTTGTRQAKGSKDIFVNILTDTGLGAALHHRLGGTQRDHQDDRSATGVPWYAYDTVTFKGEVTAIDDGLITVKVVGSNSLGDHVIATSTLTIVGEA